jgi:hypothetical protein
MAIRTLLISKGECVMTSPSVTAPGPVLATGRALRILLVAAAILVLATAAFVLGRISSGSSSGSVSPKVPAVSTQQPVSNDSGTCQQIRHHLVTEC